MTAPVTLTPDQRAELGLAPLEPPAKPKRRLWPVIGILAAFMFGVLIGSAGNPADDAPTEPAAISVPSVPAEEPLDDPAPPVEEAPVEEEPPVVAEESSAAIEKSDVKLRIKVLDKQCFGSAGCNVEVRPIPHSLDQTGWPTSGEVEWSYKITGDESGSIIGTFAMDLEDGTYEDLDEELLSTRSSGTKVTAVITSVEYIG